MKLVFIVVCGLFLLSGCATSSIQELGNTKYPPKSVDCQIDVFTSESKVEKKYEEVALITHKTGQDAFSEKGASGIIPDLKAEACKLGADGLIIRNIQQGNWGNAGHGEAVAIKYQ